MNLGCPICDRTTARQDWIYDDLVCRWCHVSFATRRYLAFLIDCASFLLIVQGAQFILAPYALFGLDPLVGYTSSSAAFWLLFGMKDSVAGMSLGKWLAGLRVVDARTLEPASVWQCFARNIPLLLPVVGWACLLVAWVQVAEGERWGDGWAGTRVVWRKHANKLPFDPRGLGCPNCGYSLRGNVSGRCPECGAPIGATLMTKIRKADEDPLLPAR